MINVYKYVSRVTRQKNYEIMLNMYNDALQGKASYLGIIFGGTPKSVEDENRGVFSYPALKSRLEAGRFRSLKLVNLMTPIIRIQPLTKSEIIVLLEKLSQIHADVHGYENTVTESELIRFVETVFNDPYSGDVTPRSIIRDFVNVLNMMYQNPGKGIYDIIEEYEYTTDQEVEPDEIDE